MRKVINIETLEIFPSVIKCAKAYGVTDAAVISAIILAHRCKHQRFEYFDEWLWWTNKEKGRYTRKNNIYFI